ncbi:hypothetical protein DIPPA_26440 [Diplonema papillatum]|nr:hypothetical protein DIPPA_26440 [Diplonema papillatum]
MVGLRVVVGAAAVLLAAGGWVPCAVSEQDCDTNCPATDCEFDGGSCLCLEDEAGAPSASCGDHDTAFACLSAVGPSGQLLDCAWDPDVSVCYDADSADLAPGDNEEPSTPRPSPTEAPAKQSNPPGTLSPASRSPNTAAPLSLVPPTEAPATESPPLPLTVAPPSRSPNTAAPPSRVPPTEAPATESPPLPITVAPPSRSPNTAAPLSLVPPTEAPATESPPLPITVAPPSRSPNTAAPPSRVPPTEAPATESPPLPVTFDTLAPPGSPSLVPHESSYGPVAIFGALVLAMLVVIVGWKVWVSVSFFF